jgi:hypothetical protein
MSINIDSDRAELLAGHATFGYPSMPPEFDDNEHRITAKVVGTIPPLVYPGAPNSVLDGQKSIVKEIDGQPT